MVQPCVSREKALVTLYVLWRMQVPLAWGRAHMTLCILASSLKRAFGSCRGHSSVHGPGWRENTLPCAWG